MTGDRGEQITHSGIVRKIPGCPRLHVESGWIRCERTRREHLVWLIYLRPPRRTQPLERRDFRRPR